MRPTIAILRDVIAPAVGRALLIAVVTSSCASPPNPPAPPEATPTPETPAAIVEGALNFRVDPMRESAVELGKVTADLFQEARAAVARSAGSARYIGNGLNNYMELSVSFAADASGFDDFEYSLACDSPTPPAICGMIHAFDAAKVARAGELLRELGVQSGIEFRVDGKADPVWQDPRRPRVYDGHCGEGSCSTASGPIHLDEGVGVKSNEILACLRALCTQYRTGLGSPLVIVKLRGVITGHGSDASERRSEIALRMELPGDRRNIIWDSFLRQVGHK